MCGKEKRTNRTRTQRSYEDFYTLYQHKEELQENYELGVKYMEDLEEKEKR